MAHLHSESPTIYGRHGSRPLHFDAQADHGEVVVLFGQADKPADIPVDVSEGRLGRHDSVQSERSAQALAGEKLLLEVHRFNHAVGIKQDEVTRRQLHGCFLVTFVGVKAEHQTGGMARRNLACAQSQRRLVAGVAEAQ